MKRGRLRGCGLGHHEGRLLAAGSRCILVILDRRREVEVLTNVVPHLMHRQGSVDPEVMRVLTEQGAAGDHRREGNAAAH
jgi:hypothetical protein